MWYSIHSNDLMQGGYSMKNLKRKIDNFSDESLLLIPWAIVVYIGAVLVQSVENISLLHSIIFSFIILIYVIFQRFSWVFVDRRKYYYFMIQSGLLFVSTMIMPLGTSIILMGLLPFLIAQAITMFSNAFKVIITFIFLYIPYCFVVNFIFGGDMLAIFIVVFFFILMIVVSYSIIYNRQVRVLHKYLRELEITHRRVEELTLVTERQRMARDLHDTLAQGLAGIIMQLEAVDSHLINRNIEKSHQIVKKSMQQARNTLAEARQVIDDLRSDSFYEINFYQAVKEEIKKVKMLTSIKIKSEIILINKLPSLIKEHSLFIISECLTNAVRHSKADSVNLKIKEELKMLLIIVEDDGIGFNINSIGKKNGHYGLVGINERVRLLDGYVKITSRSSRGTTIQIEIPILVKGAQYET